MATTILRLPAVIHRTGISRSSIYLRLSEGRFPKPILLGGSRAIGWIESEINEYIESLIQTSRPSKKDISGKGNEK